MGTKSFQAASLRQTGPDLAALGHPAQRPGAICARSTNLFLSASRALCLEQSTRTLLTTVSLTSLRQRFPLANLRRLVEEYLPHERHPVFPQQLPPRVYGPLHFLQSGRTLHGPTLKLHSKRNSTEAWSTARLRCCLRLCMGYLPLQTFR